MKKKVIVSLFLVVGLAVLAVVAFVSVISIIPTDNLPSPKLMTEAACPDRE